jgi:hypothetical protein
MHGSYRVGWRHVPRNRAGERKRLCGVEVARRGGDRTVSIAASATATARAAQRCPRVASACSEQLGLGWAERLDGGVGVAAQRTPLGRRVPATIRLLAPTGLEHVDIRFVSTAFHASCRVWVDCSSLRRRRFQGANHSRRTKRDERESVGVGVVFRVLIAVRAAVSARLVIASAAAVIASSVTSAALTRRHCCQSRRCWRTEWPASP